MSFSVFGARPASTAAPTRGTAAVQPVQAVTRDRPAPGRDFDASGTGGTGGGVAALLLGRGGVDRTDVTPAATTADEAPTIKPNLDALNRVLAHYEAQTAAAARLKP